jgi:hypothetical protein
MSSVDKRRSPVQDRDTQSQQNDRESERVEGEVIRGTLLCNGSRYRGSYKRVREDDVRRITHRAKAKMGAEGGFTTLGSQA